MANRKSKHSKNSKSFLLLLAALFIGICLYFYFTDSAFKAEVNQGVKTFVTQITGETTSVAERVAGTEPDADTENGGTEENTKASEKTSGKTGAAGKAGKNTDTPAAEGLVYTEEDLFFPLCPASKHTPDHELRNYKHYSICYRENYEQAEWSAYCLDEEELVKNASRSDDFREDPEISTGSAAPADYKKSGYDRGHLSPAADFAFSQEAMSETFYMSNMSPQAGSFNRGIWKDLESEVRVWAKKIGRVFVVSGPVLDEKPENYATIGTNKVSVPKYYYKVILAPLYCDKNDRATKDDASAVTAIGFIFPNKKCEGSFFDYACSVDEVEKRTGIDFFAGLEDKAEEEAESAFEIEKWK